MAVVQPPPGRPYTPLLQLAMYMQYQAGEFYSLSNSLAGVWQLGDYLQWPFYWIGYYFDIASGYMNDADLFVSRIKNWVDGLVDGWLFEQLLYWVSGQFRDIKYNATAWVDRYFSQLSWWLNELRFNPYNLFRTLLTTYTGILYAFWTDPVTFIRDWWLSLFGLMRTFVYNPIGQLSPWINSLYWWIAQLTADASGTVYQWIALGWPNFSWVLNNPINFVMEQLRRYNALALSLISDPFGFIRQRILTELGLPYHALGRLIELSVLNVFQLTIVDRINFESMIRNWLITVILWFI